MEKNTEIELASTLDPEAQLETMLTFEDNKHLVDELMTEAARQDDQTLTREMARISLMMMIMGQTIGLPTKLSLELRSNPTWQWAAQDLLSRVDQRAFPPS